MQNPNQTPIAADARKLDLRKVKEWLSGDVDIRVPRAWLVGGAALVVALLLIALD